MKVSPLLVEDAVESVKIRGAKLELKAAGQVGWLLLSALSTVYRKTLTRDAEIRKLQDEVSALQEKQLLMKETIESAMTCDDQMEARLHRISISDNDDDWKWEDEVEVRVAELGEVEAEKESVVEARPLVQNKSKGLNGGQIQNSRLVRDYTQSELLEITCM
ncbi:hypothetical protein NDU88_005258 [Pleurodeles waltl]|uniref:Uncharacterized protein n=1 Tax=Pleurodeles waltl TaxID=8319 RepID=A0AAV7LKL6_PLEWA|nr:hypothetical protein NDU88_005258 [Pleurodeles waltl]